MTDSIFIQISILKWLRGSIIQPIKWIALL